MKKKFYIFIIALILLFAWITLIVTGNRLIRIIGESELKEQILVKEKYYSRNTDNPTNITRLNHLVEVESAEDEAEIIEYESLGEFKLTAYCPCQKCCGVWSAEHPSRKGTDFIQKTASGTIPASNRTVGVNPKFIPYGTILLINGQEYVAEDRGSATTQNKFLIDIFMDNHTDAIQFGKQTAEVFIKLLK